MITLRDMRVADLALVSSLGIRSKASWGYSDEVMEVFAGELRLSAESLSECLTATVAEEAGEMVGFFTLKAHGMASLELDHMFVDPSRLGEGIGAELMRAALAETKARGMKELFLLSDPNAEGFYRKFGARKIGEHQSSIAGRSIPVMSIAMVGERSENAPELE